MAANLIRQWVDAPAGQQAVLQGNIAFALGCVRGGIHGADGYPGTPSTEVIDKALSLVQDRISVGWSVNEANAVAVGFGYTMCGADAVVTMKIPGLFQAADVVASVSAYSAERAGLVLYVASDFVPSSTQYLTDPRYFLKSCFIPVLEPRSHQELYGIGPLAAQLGGQYSTPIAVLVNGFLCHSEGLVRLEPVRTTPRMSVPLDFKRFMNLPSIARDNYTRILSDRMPALRSYAEHSPLNRITWQDRRLGVVVHGMTEMYLREAWNELPIKPSILSLGMTYPLPKDLVQRFAQGLQGPLIVLSDGHRFVQEELQILGLSAEGKTEFDCRTEWSPDAVAERLGAQRPRPKKTPCVQAPTRPPSICPGCPYRAFGLVVDKLRRKNKIVASFGDIGCNTLLYFLRAIDTCVCMGAADAQRQGVVLADPTLADKTISVLGDSTECHSGLDSTRNAIFRNVPGVKVILDNRTTAMTGGQPAPTSSRNLAGQLNRFDLVETLKAHGAIVRLIDAFDMKALETGLREALQEAGQGHYSVLVVRGTCMQELGSEAKKPLFEIDPQACKRCDLCLVCSGIEKGEDGYPRFTSQCTGCGGQEAICAQRCNLGAIVPRKAKEPSPSSPPPSSSLRAPLSSESREPRPQSLRIAIRGVGGQGNLFFGKVLAELALLAGFENVIKGETHGMAQLGGPVLSTFACGKVYSPVFALGTADVLVALEQSELLRGDFLQMLRPGGTILLNRFRLFPPQVPVKEYPSLESIRAAAGAYRIIEFDAWNEAKLIGDELGKITNVIALGLLSTVEPFSRIEEGLWQQALKAASPSESRQKANLLAFAQGRQASTAVFEPRPV